MWRAFFLAIGFFVMILGVECLGVEKISLKMRDDPPPPIVLRDRAEGGRTQADCPASLGALESVGLGRGDVSLLVYHPAPGVGRLASEDIASDLAAGSGGSCRPRPLTAPLRTSVDGVALLILSPPVVYTEY